MSLRVPDDISMSCSVFLAPLQQTPLAEPNLSEKVFVSQERVSGFPKKGADLRGSPGTSREVWGTSGEVWETSGEPLDCC